MNEIRNSLSTTELLGRMSREANERAQAKPPIEVIQLIQQAQNEVRSLGNRDVVLVVGATGSGKSTFINYMAGRKQVEAEYRGKYVVKTLDPITAEGHDNTSKTTYPRLYPCGSLNLCDCPGFEDNRGNEVEIANAASLSLLAKTSRKIQCLIVCMEYSAAVDERGARLKRTIDTTIEFLGHPALINSIFLLFTKAHLHAGITPTQMLEGRAEDSPYINMFLKAGRVAFYFPLGCPVEAHASSPHVFDREGIRKQVMQFEGITDPHRYFKTTLKPDTNRYIASCLKWGSKQIILLIEKRDMDCAKVVELMNSMYTLKELTGSDSLIVEGFRSFEDHLLASIEKLRYENDAVAYLKALIDTLPNSFPTLKTTAKETLAFLEARLKKEKEQAELLQKLSNKAQKLEKEKEAIDKALKEKTITAEEAQRRNAKVEAENKILNDTALKIQQDQQRDRIAKDHSKERWAKAGKFFGSFLGALAREIMMPGMGIPMRIARARL